MAMCLRCDKVYSPAEGETCDCAEWDKKEGFITDNLLFDCILFIYVIPFVLAVIIFLIFGRC